MELRELSEDFPDFDHDLDLDTLSKIPEKDRQLAITLSVYRRQIQYWSSKTVTAYNLAVQHQNRFEQGQKTLLGIPVKFVAWLSTSTIGAIIFAVVEKLISNSK